MAKPPKNYFDQFDDEEEGNYFDQFDEGGTPTKPVSVLGSTAQATPLTGKEAALDARNARISERQDLTGKAQKAIRDVQDIQDCQDIKDIQDLS